MITSKEVALYLQAIPPTPNAVRQALECSRAGDLTKAAKIASEDLALHQYLKILVNRPLYGFKNNVSDVSQIFSILGLSATQQTLYNYLLTLLIPKKWELFEFTNMQFYDLQVSFSKRWEKILHHLGVDDAEIHSVISLVPATIIVCEALFASHKEEVMQLRSVKALDFNTILQRLSGRDLFDLAGEIALLWEMPQSSIALIKSASGLKNCSTKGQKTIAQWIHLLLFYELSQGACVSAGLNEFLDFHIDFVQEIYEPFMKVIA